MSAVSLEHAPPERATMRGLRSESANNSFVISERLGDTRSGDEAVSPQITLDWGVCGFREVYVYLQSEG